MNDKEQDLNPIESKREYGWLDYIPYYTFISDLLIIFDKPFICMLGVTNFNHGMFIMMTVVCQDWFKRFMNMEPNEVT
jgi:hypothetical protein